MSAAPSLDRSTLVGDVTREVRLYCDDCPGADGFLLTVDGLADATEAWTQHRARVHGEPT